MSESEAKSLAKARAGVEADQLHYNQAVAPLSFVTTNAAPEGTRDLAGARYAIPTSDKERWAVKNALRTTGAMGGTWINGPDDVNMAMEDLQTAELAEYDQFVLNNWDTHQPGHAQFLQTVAPTVLERRRTAIDRTAENAARYARIRQLGVQSSEDLAFLYGMWKSGTPVPTQIAPGAAAASYEPGMFVRKRIPDFAADLKGWTYAADGTPALFAAPGNAARPLAINYGTTQQGNQLLTRAMYNR